MGTNKPKRPTGVTIMAVLEALGGFVMLILGGVFGLAGMAVSFSGFLPAPETGTGLVAMLAGGGMVLAGIVMLVLAWGVWAGKRWAWIIAIVFVVIGIISGIGQLITGAYQGIVSLIIQIVIAYYLFRPNVKAYFGR